MLNKKAQLLGLMAIIGLTSTILGCREQAQATAPVAAPAPVVVAAPVVRTKELAMKALMALPELKAWSAHLEKTSGGKVHGALIEYDQAPKIVNGKRYWQFSFVENGSDAAHRWESFLVAQDSDEILVDDTASDKAITLDQWRKDSKPMERADAY
ncbi:MAG: hypothetical protein V4508_12665 [Pseudomonadota bacterium]